MALSGRDGAARCVSLPLSHAKRAFVDPAPHKTRELQSVDIRLPAGKRGRTLRLTDTPGLEDGVPGQPSLRAAAALALAALRRAGLVLHVLDAALIGRGEAEPGPLERQIAAYASARAPYAVLANKIDLPWGRVGAARVAASFPGRRVIPVSALRGHGFREVRSFLARHA